MRSVVTLALLSACQDAGLTTYDTPPNADISYPADGETLRAGVEVTFVGTVDDKQTPTSDLHVTWQTGDDPQPVTGETQDDGTTTATWTPVVPGSYSVVLHVSADAVAAEDELTVLVLQDDPPTVTWSSPASDATFAAASPPDLVVSVSDDFDVASALALAWTVDGDPLDGCPAAPDSDGTATCSPASLPEGQLTICVTATDGAGGAGTACIGPTAEGCATSTWYADADGDGYGDPASAVEACDAASGYVADATDCDDGDAAVHPGADESDCADPTDYDCDGSVGYADGDGDGYAACEECDDADAAVHPGAPEVCDGVDDDCDGTVDAGATDAGTWYADADGDGYGDASSPATACDAPSGFVADATDCDDATATVSPAGVEVCDGVDQDCDGAVDEDATDAGAWYADADGDGYGDPATSTTACDAPSGYVADATDCDDADAAFHPGATEDCDDPTDYNCDGSVGYADADGDGWAACEECDDGDAAVSPAATEVCDGVDDDCDGTTDQGAADEATWFADTDADGFGDASSTTLACDAPSGFVADDTDCDDADAAVSPAATEVCNSVDDDCDGVVDEDDAADASTWYADADGDGFGDATVPDVDCDARSGFVANADDCDDADATVNPAAAEVCDGVDDDCDGTADAGATDETTWYADVDGDGYGDAASATTACDAPGGFVADATDCDDGDAAFHPGATEVCTDPTDYDCDGRVAYADADADGWAACEDCDDASASVSPSAPETCDGVDDDCDGAVDEADATDPATWYADADGDGFGDVSASTLACDAPSGFVADDTDCDDGDATISPAATEVCDGIDDDCDGAVDEADAADAGTWYADTDGDGYGDATSATLACDDPTGFVADATDCDDGDAAFHPGAAESCDDPTDYNCDGAVSYADADGDGYAACDECDDRDATVHPGATEVCDGVDDDCDGTVDQGAADEATWYADTDGDGYGDASASTLACDAPSGFVADGTDCDDTDAAVSPADAEVCDGRDDDCDGTVDEGDATDASTWYRDADADGYGRASASTTACDAPSGYVANDDDCDDTSATVSPAATETCDGVDDDCDGAVDEASAGDASTWYADTDGDGYGDAASSTPACDAPSGYVSNGQDCDDTRALTNPGASEYCNAIDDDCDGSVDEGAVDATTWYVDADADGYGSASGTAAACDAPSGYVSNADDCDDARAGTNPAATEVCDSLDDDCDGAVDEDSAADASTWYADADGDGYGNAASSTVRCELPSGYVADATDCDDTDATISPVGTEVCNGTDDDCDGTVDESDATDASTWYADADGDGYGDPDAPTTACDEPSGVVADDSDCDDTDPAVNPAAEEICDGIDDDCDGSVDFGYGVPTSYATISSAIAAAPTGTTICVGSGTYSERLTLTKQLVIDGWEGSDVTVLDGAAGGTVLTASGYAGTAEVHGLTIQNGLYGYGGGVVTSNVSLWLDDVVVRDNACAGAQCAGTGLFLSGGTIELTNVDIRDNTGVASSIVYGGAIYATSTTVTAENLRIVDNTMTAADQDIPVMFVIASTFTGTNVVVAGNAGAATDGACWMVGQIVTIAGATLDLTNATITGNTLTAGAESVTGVVHLYSSTDHATFTDVAITDNVLTSSGGFYRGGAVWSWSSSVAFTSTYSDYYDNTYTAFTNVPDPTGTNGNVAVAPDYADVSAAAAYDWDLTLASGSALIDAGSPAISDADGSVSDIGAYGGPGAADW